MVKKIKLSIIAIASLILLTSCSSLNIDIFDFDFSLDTITGLFSSDNNDSNGNSADVNNTGNITSENDGDGDQDSGQNFEKISNNDIAKIFDNMAKAVEPVESVSAVATSETVDDDENSTKTITRTKVILDPLVVHVEFEGEAQLMEMYADEHNTYGNVPGAGWVTSPDFGGHLKHVSQQINEDHILHFKNYLDYFEATSDDTHYIIDYIGPDDMFEEIFLNETILEEVFGDLYDLFSAFGDLFDMTSAGEVRMTVWKDSFLVDEHSMTVKSETSILGFSTSTTERTVQKMSYDEVEPFEIPAEVKSSAKDLMDD